MTWEWVAVIAVCALALVALTYVVMPYVRARSEEDVRKAALADVTKRLEHVEGLMAQRAPFPAGLPRRIG